LTVRWTGLALVVVLGAAACGQPREPFRSPETASFGGVRVQVTEVARDLETVWALDWDMDGHLWYTERPGRLTRQGEEPREVQGVDEHGEGGLMGLEVDRKGRVFVMYTSSDDNRIVELRPDGSQRVLVEGLAKASIHDGGRLRLGPDGMLYAGTGDAGTGRLAQRDDSLNGKILRIDPDSGQVTVLSKGHRNAQGLCFARNGRLWITEHGPDEGDEVDQVDQGSNGGWPGTTGTGRKNYTPTIAPAGCAIYDADLIPQWKGSLLFVTLKDQSLRRLVIDADGRVTGEEVLLRERLGRLRDVRVGPDGAVYLATSNRDGRGDPVRGDDRILRVAPAT
jgi:glucose/arabinose dehydrogenase